MESLRLRIQDIDFSANQIVLRDGKGHKDRLTMLPDSAKVALHLDLEKVKEIHRRDLADGYGRVSMPYALSRKYPKDAVGLVLAERIPTGAALDRSPHWGPGRTPCG